MDNKLWELQDLINKNNNAQIQGILKQLRLLISIVEDQEEDMKKMADKINELERQISQRA